jgi:hypothetical protein
MKEVQFFSEQQESQQYNRMPITVEIDDISKNIWVKYYLEEETITADCIICKKEDQPVRIQKPKDIEVGTDNSELQKVVQKKLQELVRAVEDEMTVCEGCFDEEFIANRNELYRKVLKEVQKKMGMDVDFDEQDRCIQS